MRNIISNLWFDSEGTAAADFYVSIFSRAPGEHEGVLKGTLPYLTETPSNKPKGSPMTVSFQLDGMEFIALNGGPMFSFTEAVSFMVRCENQEEIDYFWDALREGGDETAQVCGWLKDRYGLSWQIVPAELDTLLNDPDRAERVMQALLQMKKIDLEALRNA